MPKRDGSAPDFTHPRQVAAATPNKAALIMYEDGTILTYRDLVERADRAANLLASMGVEPGDTIAILMENQIRFPEICWAAKNSGLHYACISTQLNAPDILYIVENCGAKALVTSDAMQASANAVHEAFPNLPILVVDGDGGQFRAYEASLVAQPPAPLQRSRGASMLYSSGTTGRPKGVKAALTDARPEDPPSRMQFLINAFNFNANMVLANPGPFYHAAPLRLMMGAQRVGGTAIGFGKFSAAKVLDAIEAHQATHGFFVPTMFIRMLRETHGTHRAAPTAMQVAIHGAAPCPPSVKEAMLEWWGPVIYELYGGTEGMGQTSISPSEWLGHKGSVGRAPPGCVLKILDEAGSELPPHEPGFVYMANGRQFDYHGEPGLTAAARRDDGLATLGDIGYLDEEGYLYLTDRHAHMIISGGVNIYPQEAENILIQHPRVADVAVIGVPDPEFGEQVKAVVEAAGPIADATALANELIAFCRERLSPIKCPRSVDFVDVLPRSDAGKLMKRELRRRYWEGRASLIS